MGFHALCLRNLMFVSLFIGTTLANAQDSSLTIQLGTQILQLALTEHTPSGTVKTGANNANAGNHFKGNVLGIDNSWARLSRVGNNWEGVVSVDGELYLIDIDNNTQSPRSLTSQRSLPSQVITTTAASELSEIGACALQDKDHNLSISALSMSAPTASAASFLALCSSKVDDVCLLSEIDFVFDQSFQSSYPSDYEARATQMINIVEGYYLNAMNIAFQTLSKTFLSSEVFSSTTNSVTLLEDVSARKRNNELAFISKDEALIQFVTARDFDGSTVGVAWLEGLCDGSGYWTSSTVQLVDSIPLTALISAHEIGHNLGAGHDGDGNACSSSGYIMAASLNPFVSSFSTCTLSYIQDAISNVTNQDACFDYPYDIEILDLNSSDLETSETLSRSYRVDSDTASRAINEASINGSITTGGATFIAVSIDSTPCTLSHGNKNYSCVLNNPNNNHSLVVELTTATGSYSLSHSVSVSQSDLVETDRSNNSLIDNFTYAGGGISEPVPEEETPGSSEPEGSSVEENLNDSQTDTNSSNNSETSAESGSGGALECLLFMGLMTVFIRRKLAITIP